MRIQKSFKAVAVSVVAALAIAPLSQAHPAAAAPAGKFDGVNLIKVRDGFEFQGNPVDTDPNDNKVAVNDVVGFAIEANTIEGNPVRDAVLRVEKPECWAWPTNMASLSFTVGGVTATTELNDNVATIKWNQNANLAARTDEFRFRPGPTCAPGSTWTPKLTITDAAGTREVQLDPITVLSVPKADISIRPIGGQTREAAQGFGKDVRGFDGGENMGTIPANSQGWEVKLSANANSAYTKVGYAELPETIRFSVNFKSEPSELAARSAFQFPPRVVTECWTTVSPGPYHNYPAGHYQYPSGESNNAYPSSGRQTVYVEMKTTGKCARLLAQDNKMRIYSFTPESSFPKLARCLSSPPSRPLIGKTALVAMSKKIPQTMWQGSTYLD